MLFRDNRGIFKSGNLDFSPSSRNDNGGFDETPQIDIQLPVTQNQLPLMTRHRQDPYQEDPEKTTAFIWIARLIVLFIVVTFVATAVIILVDTVRGIASFDNTAFSGGSPNLNPVERLVLENYLSSRTESLAQPVGSGTDPVIFTIESGQGANQVAANLAAAGLLFDTELFVNYVRYQGIDAQLATGQFRIHPTVTIPELASILTRSQIIEVEVSFLPGWRLEEMANYLQTVQPAEIEPDAFLALAQRTQSFPLNGYSFFASMPAGATMEGFLFPGTYTIQTDLDAAGLIGLMLSRFEQTVTADMREQFALQGLTTFEAVTLASIVHRESVLEEERPLIAGVFLNRLRLGMPLQADATAQYALGSATNGWWKSPLTPLDLGVDSPYNTYLAPALPPGPIANPGLSALNAVASPEATDFIFFVADCSAPGSGKHLFAVTYDEHIVNVNRCN